MNDLKLRVERDRYVRWPNGGGFQPVSILVDDRELIDLVRAVEQPFAEAEWDRRVADGERPDDLGPRGSIAGRYLYPNLRLAAPALRGAPYDHGFAPRARNAKSLLLQCTCGVTECWFLLARIDCGRDVVRWSDFEQFHRDWRYDLRFEFDRAAYDQEVTALEAAARG